MAEQFYAAVNHSFSAAQYSTPVVNLPNGPPLLSNSHVKQETSCTNQRRQVGVGTNTGRPSKRQKTGDIQARNSHKFVSQKKWKFSDAQPWLPSKTSSKAQNASKANTKYQHRSVSPKRSASPQITLKVPDVDNLLTLNKPSSIQLSHQHLSSQGNLSPAVSNQEAVPQNGNHHGSPKPRSQQIQNSIELLPVVLRSSSGQEESSRDGRPIRELSGEIEVAEPYDELRATSETPKPSRLPHALSLEKDAARIAALIAEKRKENETSMFRERMLRKQFEHRTHKDNGKPTSSTSNASISADATESHISSSPFSDGESSQGLVESSPSTVESALSPEILNHPRTIDVNDEARSIVRVRKSASRRNGAQKARSSKNDKNDEPGESTSASADRSLALDAPNQSLSPDSIINYFGKDQSPEVLSSSNRFEGLSIHNQSTSYTEPHGRSAPFEAEDADVAAQFAAFTTQLLRTKPAREEQPSVANLNRQPHSMFYQRQLSSSLLPTRSQGLQQCQSAASDLIPNHNRLSIQSVQQSARLSSSQSPNEMSVRQSLPSDIVPSQHSPTRIVSRSVSGTGTSNAITPLQPIAYRTMSQQAFVPSSQQRLNTEAPVQITHPSSAAQHTMPHTPGASMLLQQHFTQRPLLASNVNMFNGEVRSNSSNEAAPSASKPRVNMFGNTKGSPFTMHEVIRQIEMT